MVSFSFSSSLALLSLFTSVAYAAGADEWRARSIYQILTDRFAVGSNRDEEPCKPENGVHCGGSWKGITEHLDYIQGMNFDAIWISPIVEQMPNWTGDGEAYSGYWQQNLYELNPAYGSEEDLVELITEVHQRGMLFMLDIVVNHMVGPKQENNEFDYSLMRPFNDAKYFHEYCPSGYSDEDLDNLQNCWLGSLEAPLADLKTESQEVKDMLGMWIKNQVWKYGIDGLRIDAAINVPKEFFPEFMEHAGIFATSEVYTQMEDLACQYTPGIPSILNYPLYWPMTAAFAGPDGNFETLKGMTESIRELCHDSTVLGNFAENHDVARFRNNTEDISRAENIGAYVLLADGIPVIMYGQEQFTPGDVEPYYNRAALWDVGYDEDAVLYKLFAKLNLFRRFMGRQYPKYLTNLAKAIKVESNTITWAKGGDNGPNAISIFNNKGGDADDFAVELCDGHGYSSGDELMDVVSCKSVEVGGNGCIEAWVSDGHPVVLLKKSALEGSGLCDFSDDIAALESKAVISTTWTTTVEGRATVMHSATTMPWADAPASITSTSSTGAASSTASSDSESSGGKKFKRHLHNHKHGHARSW